MIQIGIRWVAGRFHATPWGCHVNEGVPEWPPSPWRILRALLAVRYELPFSDDERRQVRAVVQRLAPPPSFYLPPATVGHTRHYMPLNQPDRSKTALVFDTFVAVSREQEVAVRWPVDLPSNELVLLEALLKGLRYIGRAESWVEVRLLGGDAPQSNCLTSDGLPSSRHSMVRVLCAAPSTTLDDLEKSTRDIVREGWSDPPGSQWVFYKREEGALRPRQASPREIEYPSGAQVVEFAVGGTPRPLLTDAVNVSDALHRAALFMHGSRSDMLSGKDARGAPLKDQHRHAHYVADSRNSDGRISHLMVWAPGALSSSELSALARISYVRTERAGFVVDHPVLMTGFGSPAAFEATPLFRHATRWRSVTPFVLPRHPKRSKDTANEQFVRELSCRGLPAPKSIVPVSGASLDGAGHGAQITRWVAFDLRRKGRWPRRPVGGFEVEFVEPVAGPILLGFGSHHGLGAFTPME